MTQAALALDPRPLDERSVDVCLAELAKWGDERPSKARIAEYFSGAMRAGARLDLSAGAHCVAAQGWCEHRAARPGELVPVWRAATVEKIADAKAGRNGLTWLPVEDVRAGALIPKGALACYLHADRPGFGHTERVISHEGGPTFETIGANEELGAWVRELATVNRPTLEGFVVGPPAPPPSSSSAGGLELAALAVVALVALEL
jgi:hypothetical protein